VQTSELPAGTGLCEATSTLVYHRVEIGEGSFLLPKQSQLRLLSRNGQETNNSVVFGVCREFQSASAVRFDTTENTLVGTLEPPSIPGKPRTPAPPGLAVDLRLTTPIDTDTSAAGDRVTATVVHPVHRHQSGETVIPAGAVVHGRISRMEHHLAPTEYLLIGLSFESVDFDGQTSPFAVETEAPAHYYRTLPWDALRQLYQRTPTPPRDSIEFRNKKHHVMAPGTITYWITARPNAAH
jgi:hypothetical protein